MLVASFNSSERTFNNAKTGSTIAPEILHVIVGDEIEGGNKVKYCDVCLCVYV